MELRDRTGFDFDGRGQNERGAIDWIPGVSLAYTDEARGYGNVTAADRPNQTVLDSEPTPFGTVPNAVALNPDLSDAAWRETDTAYSDFGDGHTDNYVEFDPATGAPIPWTLQFDCFSLDVTGMSGDAVGPSGPPGDLLADVELTRGDGCGDRDYGFGSAVNAAPDAVAQAKATTLRVGEEVLFDGGLSTDDVTPTAELDFAWDFDGDGTVDATTQQVTTSYDEPGTYDATLTVTDEGDRSGSDTVAIRVVAGGPTRPGAPGGPEEPRTDPDPDRTPPPLPGPGPGSDEETDRNVVSRLAGPGRIETAIEVSQAAFESADAVVLARADQFPDALAAATLAAEVGGPVLLTGSDQLDLRVAREILRLGAGTVYLAGGEVALAAQVADDLEGLEVAAPRLEGVERTDTAARIAQEVVAVGARWTRWSSPGPTTSRTRSPPATSARPVARPSCSRRATS